MENTISNIIKLLDHSNIFILCIKVWAISEYKDNLIAIGKDSWAKVIGYQGYLSEYELKKIADLSLQNCRTTAPLGAKSVWPIFLLKFFRELLY